MHPIGFVKNHPVGFLCSMAAGMIAGPWLVGTIQRTTGVGISLPNVGRSS